MEQKEYRFEFSVVMAVYNVEPWLREAVDSLIAQDFGFERIQLIMVDDGSTDGSGAICDEYAVRYPENVMVVHKANGGLSSARNTGVRVAEGRYLSFFDPDDLLDKQVFSSVHSFFRTHESEVDVVVIPMMLFGKQTGEHPANKKFKKGTRVIDLTVEWNAFHLSLASSFLRADSVKESCFKEDLVMATAEDAKELIKLFLRNPRLGVVNGGYYHYRKRDGSQVAQSSRKTLGYIPYLRDFSQWALDYSIEQLGNMPKYVQNIVMYDLQWKVRISTSPLDILTEEEANEYVILLKQILARIDDDVIMAQKNIFPEHKAWILEQKYEKELQPVRRNGQGKLTFGDRSYFNLGYSSTRLEFLAIEEGICSLEGYTTIYPVHIKDVQLKVMVNGKAQICEAVERNITLNALGEPISYRFGFKASFPLERKQERYTIRIVTVMQGIEVRNENLIAGPFFPISRTYNNSYFLQDAWCVSMSTGQLSIVSCGRKGHLKKELAFLRELWKRNELGGRKAVLARIAYYALKAFKKKEIWLISDRINKADDNGEAFFRYMQENHRRQIKSYFVLSKTSSDYRRIKKIGAVADNLSWKHKMLFLLSDYTISAQADAITANPFLGYGDGVKDILSQERFIFLQHGVTKDDISGWINRYNKNFYGLVACAHLEYDSFLRGAYYYDESRVWLTGFPRFDRRYRDERRRITIMPTWRMYLLGAADQSTSFRELRSGFEKSAFFEFYQALLSDERLLDSAKKNEYHVCFFPHPNMQRHLSKFSIDPRIEVLDINTKYNDVYAQSDLVVTDYSSAVFDFAYLRKPIIYCQFDAEEFFAGEHVYTRGYFDYERDGFGEVEYDLESTVDRIIEYMENGCQLKDQYRQRIDGFFAFNDQNNCQRVYEKIMELDGRK